MNRKQRRRASKLGQIPSRPAVKTGTVVVPPSDGNLLTAGRKQRVAARRIGTTQPELSKILGGKFTEVSLKPLMRFLTALGYHIEIKIGAGQANKAGDVTIRDTRRTAA